ncbi:PucR family transcriptional regulator [Planosporangium mesophilum]|uniref:PucR family transcriptional regulator n=1 Tax=Planosporangium mesophilum TaxID=689768 RepID=UPI001439344A|nr:PucR family transcriptional regulator [Planosporangium mesophilum]NJC84108.1 PucR family transcriptional regulator [Planosporangium mesophilum]
MERRDGARTAESLAASVLLRVPAVTDRLVRTIYEQNPGYLEVNSVPADDLWQSCHDNITRVLQLVAGMEHRPDRSAVDDYFHIDDYFDAAYATGRRRAEQRMPLDDVLRSFRLGGRLVWEALIDEAREQGMVDMDALLDVAGKVWEVVDSTSSRVAVAYHSAERHLVRADEQRRAALWEGLLHGRAKDLAFAYEAARTLGVPVDGRYAVVAVEVQDEDDRAATLLERRLAGARVDSVWQLRAHTLVGLLALGTVALDVVLGVLRGAVRTPAGLSGVVSRLSDVDVAYRQATLARRTLPADRVEVASLAERLPEALLLSSPELARQLVELWLAPLMTLPAAERQLLLDTLEMWVAAAGSIRRTAELAHCHRNTVLNRLHRIHQITGRDLTAAAFQVELGLALRAARLFPPTPHG